MSDERFNTVLRRRSKTRREGAKPSVDRLTEPEAATFLGVTETQMQAWRRLRIGPDFLRYNEKVVRYDRADLLAWLESRKVRTENVAGLP